MEGVDYESNILTTKNFINCNFIFISAFFTYLDNDGVMKVQTSWQIAR